MSEYDEFERCMLSDAKWLFGSLWTPEISQAVKEQIRRSWDAQIALYDAAAATRWNITPKGREMLKAGE